MKLPIYFDYAATTPVDPRVAQKMMDCLTLDGNFGNPASRSHAFGWKAEEAVENARSQVAAMIGAVFILDDPIFNGLAISLLFGIAVSTLLTLVVIPVLYYALYRRRFD